MTPPTAPVTPLTPWLTLPRTTTAPSASSPLPSPCAPPPPRWCASCRGSPLLTARTDEVARALAVALARGLQGPTETIVARLRATADWLEGASVRRKEAA